MALEIKEGLSYMDASGDEIGPMEFDNRTGTSYVWDCLRTGRSYTRDGKYMENGSDPHLNLVSEIRPSIDGPIRTVTRREIVPGEYGSVRVWPDSPIGMVRISLTNKVTCGDLSANELRSAAMVLSQLAKALDDNADKEKE